MLKVHLPPNTVEYQPRSLKVFLAGTIDMGESRDWQSEMIANLSDGNYDNPVDVLNPRRPDWDSSWGNGHPKLIQQIEWELDGLEKADDIIMALMPGSKSPISLLELGAFRDKRIHAYVPHEFYRHTNIAVFANRYGIALFPEWTQFKKYMRQIIIHRSF